MILRPGSAGFDAMALLAVAGTLGFAGRDLATRAAPKVLSNAQLGVAGFAMLVIAGAMILGFSGGRGVARPSSAGFVVAASAFGILGYAALTQAMRTGEISVVTPFRYTRLVFALVLGFVAFGERPDATMSARRRVIVGSGSIPSSARAPWRAPRSPSRAVATAAARAPCSGNRRVMPTAPARAKVGSSDIGMYSERRQIAARSS